MSWVDPSFALLAAPGLGVVVFLGGYLLGCLATGYYLVRFLLGRDIRREGSGSIGARNVGRLLGVPGFLAVLLLDLGKGALAVALARRFTGDDTLALLALLAVTIGHIWPAQLRFHGGKGVSTSLGALLVLDYRLALAFAAMAGLGMLFLRNFTASGLVAFALLPLVAMAWPQPAAMVVGISLLTALVLFAHRKNLEEEINLLTAGPATQPKPGRKT
jgi:glycerol-3-phosphate acyltransferase PlsY